MSELQPGTVLETETTFITAREARARITLGKTNIDRMLKAICKKIGEMSLVEKDHLILEYDLPYWQEFKVDSDSQYTVPNFTPIQFRLKQELEKLGFRVEMHAMKVTIGGGFKSLDEESREETRYRIKVSW